MKKLIEEVEDKYEHVLQVWGGKENIHVEAHDFEASVEVHLDVDKVRSLVDSLSWWLAIYDRVVTTETQE